MKQILIIGSTALDIIIQIPHLPVTGEDIHVTSQTFSLGGCAYNASDILRLWDVPYILCSPVGEGVYADIVRDKLQKKGIPISISVAGADNGCCYCMVEESGERTFISHHGVEYSFQKSWIETIDMEQVDSVYICGLEIEETGGNEIIDFLEEHQEFTIFFATGPRICKIDAKKMERIFQLSPIIHLNEGEATSYTQTNSVEEAARVLYERTRNAVIITCGERGAYLMEQGKGTYISGYEAKVVDTIGAGDSHIGAVMAGYQQGKKISDAVKIANKVSAAVVGVKGANLPDAPFSAIDVIHGE